MRDESVQCLLGRALLVACLNGLFGGHFRDSWIQFFYLLSSRQLNSAVLVDTEGA